MKHLRVLLTLLLLSTLLYSSEESPTQDEVAKLYVATFNRAPDSAGLDYWVSGSGLTLSQIAQSFFDQTETQTLYPPETSNRDFINSVYQNLFNRAPDAAGWDYWENELNIGSFSKNRFIEAVINGAQDSEISLDATILNNKNSVGIYFAQAGLEDTVEATSVMREITADTLTVDAAFSSIDIMSTTTASVTNGTYTLLAWNDLGMHCFDGSDFSVFSILPPYNNLNAHLINKVGTSNKHITTGVTLTYESLTYSGQVNTISSNKTNFWDYLTSLFPGSTSVSDVGLTGNKTPSTTPQAMSYNSTHSWWEADGIPIVNRDDDNETNYYPMVRVVAKDSAGATLATADVVLPVSDEMDCAKCHASTVASTDAKPASGWENSSDALKDYKYNILKLHDEKHPINSSDLSAVQAKGYANYQASLYNTAKSGTPILCSSCHSSNALGTTSIGNAKSLTASIHSKHADVIDPGNGLSLENSSNRTACYSCHPGAVTECLRGAMGNAKDASGNQMMQCQSCHGTMSDVGNVNRIGWLEQPNCQVCHQNAQRYESALVNGSLRDVLDTRFATNPNTPSAGITLYRFSTGHGDLQCSSCHGSTHAIFPSSHAQDNIYSEQIQGHSGTVAECTSCHTTVPRTTTGGPHGMHTVGQSWVDAHEDIVEGNAAVLEGCKTCHGSDYRGSVLSKTFDSRVFDAEHETKVYNKGDKVGCYDCHNGPNG